MTTAGRRRGPTSVVRALPTLFRVASSELVAWRAEVLIWILTSTMPLVMLAIWDAVTADGPVAGLGQADVARYFTVTLVIRQLTSCWVVWELNATIRSGALSPQLLRPLHPLWYQAMRHWVAVPLRSVVLVPLVLMLMAWRPEMALTVDAGRLGALVLSCALAWVVVFGFQVAFGCLAFWYGQSIGVFNLWFGLWSIFGGYLMPLSVMPEPVRAAADWLPFRAMLATPVEIGADILPRAEWGTALAVQLGWAVLATALAAWVWRAGLRRYGAFGA